MSAVVVQSLLVSSVLLQRRFCPRRDVPHRCLRESGGGEDILIVGFSDLFTYYIITDHTYDAAVPRAARARLRAAIGLSKHEFNTICITKLFQLGLK